MSNNTQNDLLIQAFKPTIVEVIGEHIGALNIEERINDAVNNVAQNATKLISVSTNGGEPINIGMAHKQFELITRIMAIGGINLMLTGQAGNAKSHTLNQVATALGLEYHSISVNMQTTKTDLLGFVDANGVYRYNGFVTAFREGGFFNLDEIDAGNANVLTVLNNAISTGKVELPNGEMAIRHDNFRMACTANTVGTGANTKYVGRNKLDAATLDRFAVIHFELDEDLEEKLCGDKSLASGFRAMRSTADAKFEDIMITMRSCIGTSKLIKAGIDVYDALQIHCFKGIDEDAKSALLKQFKANYKAPEPKKQAVEQVFTTTAPEVQHSGKECTACGNGHMIEKEGKYGKFMGCTNYPECSHTEKIDNASTTTVDDDPFAF